MATREQIAKENVMDKIAAAFGEDYAGFDGKRYYVWTKNGGERVQVAFQLTCPKKEFIPSEEPTPQTIIENSIEFTEQERQTLKRLMEGLGIDSKR